MAKHRSHVPALDEPRLKNALEQVAALDISEAAKLQLIDILRAAANPNAESPAVVIASLDSARRLSIRDAARRMDAFTTSVAARGRIGLEALSAAEWDRLVDEAASGDA